MNDNHIGVSIPKTVGEQAFRLVAVNDEIGKLQYERNLLTTELSKIQEVTVAHGDEFDVVISKGGEVRKANHADGPKVRPALPIVPIQTLAIELQRCVKRILESGCVVVVPSGRDKFPNILVTSAAAMYVARRDPADTAYIRSITGVSE